MSLTLDHPAYLALLLLAAPIVWLGIRRLGTVERPRRIAALVLRCVVLTLLVLMLAGLRAERRHEDLTVIAVVDESASMRVFGRPPPPTGNAEPAANAPLRTVDRGVREYLTAAASSAAGGGRRPDDRFGLVTYDARPTVRVRPGPEVRLEPGDTTLPLEGTDTAAALEWAVAAKSDADTALRLVLVSDGNDTAGDTLAAARAAAAAGVAIDVLPIAYDVGEEVMVEGVYTPIEANEGQTVPVRVVLRATTRAAGQLQLQHDGRTLDLNGDAPGTGQPVRPEQWSDTRAGLTDDADPAGDIGGGEPSGGDGTGGDASGAGRYLLATQVDVPIRLAGANRFEAVFEPRGGATPGGTPAPGGALAPEGGSASGGALASVGGRGTSGGDTELINNRAQAFTMVHGQGRVLIVDNVENDNGLILPKALRDRRIALDVVPPAGLPTTMADLTRYDAVLFQNVPSDLVTGRQQDLLARYVNDLGGGFVMVGGPQSFGAGGWTNTVIDTNILPVACEIPAQTVLPSGALVLVIDRSGSMGQPGTPGSPLTQQHLANEAAWLAVQTLYERDLFGVVAFDSFSSWVVDLQFADDLSGVRNKIMSITPAGGTDILSGLRRAYDGLSADNALLRSSSVKHIILLSDGGSEGDYKPLTSELNRAGITLSTIGVGVDHNAKLLDQLALDGGGEYHPIVDPNDLPQVFIKEARTIRKNLIKEADFTPRRVQTGSPVMVGLDATPDLGGFVLTGPKYDRRIDTPLEGPEGEPLFAHWQVGLGKAAAFTSDATNRWATPWLDWPGYGDFWARTVRYVSRPSASRDAELTASVDGDTLRIRVDTPPGTDGLGRSATVRGKLLLPGPDEPTVDITLNQTGPGVYEASYPATLTGSYILNLFLTDTSGGASGGGGDADPQFIAGGATRAPGAELRRFSANLPLLGEVAAITGGRVLDPADPAAAGLFDRSHRFTTVSSRPLRWVLLPWLLAALLLDIANRRLAWDGPALAAWVRSRATVNKRTPAETRETLAALRQRRNATTSTPPTPSPLASPASAGGPRTSTLPNNRTPSPNRSTPAPRPLRPNTPSSKLSDPSEPTPTPAPDPDAPTTSRLLHAKRRAREQQN